MEKISDIESISSVFKDNKSIFGASPPAVFVGRYGYPDVQAGPMIPPEIRGVDAISFDDPRQLCDLDIRNVIASRTRLIRANTCLNVTDAGKSVHKNPLLLKSQEIALSKNPVDTEAWFSRSPSRDMHFDDVLTPMGPSGIIEKLDVVDNPSVPRKVDYLAYDTDASAEDAVSELYSGNIPVHHITHLLSIGLLGKQRRLVPTRWSITAVDDMAGKKLIEKIRDYPQISDFTLFSGELFGNYFEVLLIPRTYSFELIEAWMPRAVWSGDEIWVGSDHETVSGKKGYSTLAGGYYSARLAALEYLFSIHRQASIFIVREIRPQYWAPLGVWVVREGVRRALNRDPEHFSSIEEALKCMSMRLETHESRWRPEAKLLDEIKCQRTLDHFI